MKFRAYWALAKGVLLETVRRKDLWVVAILGFLIIAASGTLGFFGMRGLEVFAKDLAANVLGLFATTLAILTASRQLPEEVKNRTLYPLLARPITRFDFLIGKLLGAILASWIAFLVLAVTVGIGLFIFGVQFEPVMLQYLLVKMVGLAFVCALSLSLSVFMTPAAAATMSFILAFGSGKISQALVMSYSGASPSVQPFYRAVNAVLPHYDLFDLGSRAANIGWGPAPLWVVLLLLLYCVAYSGGLMTLSWLRFRGRAL